MIKNLPEDEILSKNQVLDEDEIVVTREYLISLLELWKQDKITAKHLHNIGNILYLAGVVDWEEGDFSISRDVLTSLDMLDVDLISKEDIEPYKEFLRTPIGCYKKGADKLERYKKNN